MILLTGAVAGIGYLSLADATDNFTEYRRFARLNVMTSDMLTNQRSATADIRNFRVTLNPELMKTARGYIDATRKLLTEADALAQRIRVFLEDETV